MKAYVIMPYGGTDENRVREFRRVYRYLIQDAIDAYDSQIQIIRQDYSHEGGLIMRNIIDNIATSDIVVADISDGNWNVAYELGLRHAMNKYGTILICNDRTPLPYDITQMNVIIYPAESWLDTAEQIAEQITNAIGNAMKHARSDSPVFDVFPNLPDNIPLTLGCDSGQEQERIFALTEELERAKDEIRQLRSRIEEAGLDSTETKHTRNLHEVMQKAVAKRALISDEAVARLQALASEKKYQEFAEFLAKVLEDGYLDEIDCKKVFAICARLDIPDITKAFLETVVEFYPDSEELRAWLANAYSTDYHDRDKAISLVNEALGIRRRDGKYEITNKVRTNRMIGAMFDVYLHLKKYEDIIEIGTLLLEAGNTKHSALVHRNICYAAIHLEEFETARVAQEKAIEAQPENAMSHYARYKYCDATNERIGAIEALEMCIHLEPDDTDYYFLMAGEICDELYARDPKTKEIRRIDAKEREKFAAPFVLRAFLEDQESVGSRTVDFLQRNNFNNTLRLLMDVVQGSLSMEEFMDQFNFDVVDYCYHMA